MSDMLPETYGQGFSSPEAAQESHDFSTPAPTGNESTTNSQEDNSNSSRNPAWEEALAAIPQEFHGHLEQHFTKWDSGVQKRFEKVQQEFAPLKAYEEFAKLNVPTRDIEQALQAYQAINTQPKAVYEYLKTQYNFGNEESQGQQEVQDYDLSEENDLTKNPQFQQMAEKASRAEQFVTEFQRQQEQAKVNAQVDAEANAVKEQFPHLDLQAVAKIAMGESRQNNAIPDLMSAAKYLDSLIPKARVSDSAPPLVPGGNRGIPQQPQKHFGDMTSDERSAYIAAQMAAMNAG